MRSYLGFSRALALVAVAATGVLALAAPRAPTPGSAPTSVAAGPAPPAASRPRPPSPPRGRRRPPPPPACVPTAEQVRFDFPLPRTARLIASGEPVKIVALGSSSTYGAGASTSAAAYPSRLAE